MGLFSGVRSVDTDAALVANVNGTVYMYGGRAKTESGQTANTWSKWRSFDTVNER